MEHMVSSELQSTQLLTEIRDLQQQILAEYSRVANEALALQREAFTNQQHAIVQQTKAIEMQRKSARLYRIVVFVAAPILGFLIWKLSFGF